MILDQSPEGLAALYADIGRQLDSHRSAADALDAVAHTAVARVRGTDWASITRGRHGSFQTVAASHPAAAEVDGLQYELGSGPCVDAIVQETVFRTGDIGNDPRWPKFGSRAAQAGVRSMLSFRLYFEEDDDLIAGLNLYGTSNDAFDDDAQTVGTLLATHGALAISAAAARERATQLQNALITNRNIGVAMGVLMATRPRRPRYVLDVALEAPLGGLWRSAHSPVPAHGRYERGPLSGSALDRPGDSLQGGAGIHADQDRFDNISQERRSSTGVWGNRSVSMIRSPVGY